MGAPRGGGTVCWVRSWEMKLMAGLRPSVRSSGSADTTSAILSVIFRILHVDENRTNGMTDCRTLRSTNMIHYYLGLLL